MLLIILAGVLLAAAICGLGGGAVLLATGKQGRVNSRLRQFVATAASVPTTLPRQGRRASLRAWLAQIDARRQPRPAAQVLANELERANLTLTLTEFTLMRVGAAVLLALVVIVLAGQIWWAVFLPAAAVGASLPRRYVRWINARRLGRLDNQLPDLMNILAGSIRTGSSLMQALERLASEAEEPSRSEYLRVVRAVNLGATLDQALRGLAERIPSEDIEMLVTAISIQQQTGGNLGQTFDLIATTVRERHRIHREIKSLSAQQRVSAYMLAALPVGLTGVLFMISPHYIGRIFEPGWMLLMPCSVVGLLVVGFVVMNRIAAIDV